MKYLKITLFTIIAFISLLALIILFGLPFEYLDGYCSYKKEYGVFPYYRISGDYGPAEHCATGIIYSGLIKTMSLTLVVGAINYFTWIKLIKK